tara:strand:+ start:629 stop:889 length:261 start_codon:yes stop_codon:yes gene_type:complete
MDKKQVGACGAGFIAALMYGGAQLMTMESRLEALEGLHPELDGGEELEDTEPVAEPEAVETTDPAPGEDALELNEENEWVAAEPVE